VEPVSLDRILLLYSWFPLAVLLLILLLIARFYQKFSGERTYFEWYGLPLVLFGIAMVRYASIDRFVGDPLADTIMGVAGMVLLSLSLLLFRLMLVGRGE
jgi:hypothetical protein